MNKVIYMLIILLIVGCSTKEELIEHKNKIDEYTCNDLSKYIHSSTIWKLCVCNGNQSIHYCYGDEICYSKDEIYDIMEEKKCDI